MPWKKTPFSSLEEAKKVAEAMDLQPSLFTLHEDITYFDTKDGVRVAQRGGGPVLQLEVPKTWTDYRRYYSGLWIEEPDIKDLKEVFRLMEKKYEVGDCIHDWILHYSIRGKSEVMYRIDPDGKVYRSESSAS